MKILNILVTTVCVGASVKLRMFNINECENMAD